MENSKAPDEETPSSFYTDCVAAFHEVAKERGYTKSGIVMVPELMAVGSKVVLAFLQDKFFQMEFQSNPQQYYFAINSICIMTGVVFASVWHKDYSKLTEKFIEKILDEGPPDYAEPILKKDAGMRKDEINTLFVFIFSKWLEMNEPYWELPDSREYTFQSMLASYQLGISLILSKYGY